jgi:dolichyl-phosphate beta-glucosyltransferase
MFLLVALTLAAIVVGIAMYAGLRYQPSPAGTLPTRERGVFARSTSTPARSRGGAGASTPGRDLDATLSSALNSTTTATSASGVDASASSTAQLVDPAPTVSIVIPCYNEQDRLPPMLATAIEFCTTTVTAAQTATPTAARDAGLFRDFEIIVVDDCSTDGTAEVVQKFAETHKGAKIRLVSIRPNRGKGYAVRAGFFAASGEYVLMADGDGATKFSDLSRLLIAARVSSALSDATAAIEAVDEEEANSPAASAPVALARQQARDGASRTRLEALRALPPIVVGSRAHMEDASIATRTLGRTILMKAFHLVVNVCYLLSTRGRPCPIRDTQCGFKLFDRRVCTAMFANARLERFAFDVELLILARRLGAGVKEVPVTWHEVPGSKVNLRAMAQMGLECAMMCVTYGLGSWRIKRSVVAA